MKLLTVKDLAISYQGYYLFDNLNFSVETGQRLIIVGESGSGKSSILKAILKAISYQGDITVDSKVSYMPQDLALLDHKTVRQNVELPALIDKTITVPRTSEYARYGLDRHLDTYVSRLSGGERQRVALMRALASGGKLLLFDEPLSKLDQINKARMTEYFKTNITDDYGLVYITHDLNEAVTLGTQILVLSSIPQLIDNNLPTNQMKQLLSEILQSNI